MDESTLPTIPTTSSEERNWAMGCHLAGLLGSTIIGVGHILIPLVIWLLKKDQFPLVNDQGKEAINFQISITIYAIISALFVFFLIGIPMLIALGIFDLVVCIIAAIKASEGQRYRYPLTIRFVS